MSKSVAVEPHTGSVNFEYLSNKLNSLLGRTLTAIDISDPDNKPLKDTVKFLFSDFKEAIGTVAYGYTGVIYKAEEE